MPKNKKKAPKKSAPRAVKFAPDAPEARDEGPRLVPLPEGVIPVLPDHSRYLALADEALNNKPAAFGQKKKHKPALPFVSPRK